MYIYSITGCAITMSKYKIGISQNVKISQLLSLKGLTQQYVLKLCAPTKTGKKEQGN